MGMRLKSFQVHKFRSVDDSGVVETDGVTALIGVNESGKSNLLLPLWKLNPAKDGEIKPTADYPRKLYNDFRSSEKKPVFIDCTFEPSEDIKQALVKLTGAPVSAFATVRAQRKFDGKYYITFPSSGAYRQIAKSLILAKLTQADTELKTLTPLKSEESFVASVSTAMVNAINGLGPSEYLRLADLEKLNLAIPENTSPLKTSSISPRYAQLREEMLTFTEQLKKPLPDDVSEARQYALNHLPHFVYYTNYGNLDSEIYLPHVIANMSRSDLGAREEAKVRTLKVLFDFVGLKPEEILELGKDFKVPSNREPTELEIAEIAEKKKERSILLQSASTKLTTEFREWWKQGEYRFRFEADGDHFRIWVSDDRRPEEVELEGRSTGLQWFLSFYLVFLVESKNAHEGSILLLDEPGMSLHPLAQKDLSVFFDGLADDNQLIYTTHSPFLIDADRLDRARKVFISADGSTKATPDLRSNEGNKSQRASGYAVLAALGLTVAESLLLGCTTVIVEGLSDQMYLSAIKTLLIASGRITPSRDIIFPPAGGAKGVKAVASILTGRDEKLPVTLFDSDPSGASVAKQLKQDLYSVMPDRVLQVGSFTPLIANDAEIEDLIPAELMVEAVDRWIRSVDGSFEEKYAAGTPMVPQIEAWAATNNFTLVNPGWKVELAKRVKQILLLRGITKVESSVLDGWSELFAALQI